MSSDTAHGRNVEETGLYWADANGDPHYDIVVLRSEDSPGTILGGEMLPGWYRHEETLLVFDVEHGTFVKTEIPAGTSEKTLTRLTWGAGFVSF